jgi:hypothetical protein
VFKTIPAARFCAEAKWPSASLEQDPHTLQQYSKQNIKKHDNKQHVNKQQQNKR